MHSATDAQKMCQEKMQQKSYSWSCDDMNSSFRINIRFMGLVEDSIIVNRPHSGIRMDMSPDCHINLIIIENLF